MTALKGVCTWACTVKRFSFFRFSPPHHPPVSPAPSLMNVSLLLLFYVIFHTICLSCFPLPQPFQILPTSLPKKKAQKPKSKQANKITIRQKVTKVSQKKKKAKNLESILCWPPGVGEMALHWRKLASTSPSQWWA